MKSLIWKKRGLIFRPPGKFNWSHNYAQVPTPLEFENRIRIFYTTRPESEEGEYISYTSYVDVEKENPEEIIYIHDRPILQLGESGSFDQYGIMPGSLLRRGDQVLLYYTGWSREISVPYTTAIGLAISYDDGTTFTKVSNGPVMAKNIHDPFLINGPHVLLIDDLYYMWYSSCYKWVKNQGRIDPVYKIKNAISNDGINWVSQKEFCIPEILECEAQNAPFVQLFRNKYYMWFCFRPGTNFRNPFTGYKLGLAASADLKTWIRTDDIAFKNIRENDWDSEMQAYPRIIRIEDKFYLFYNGNEFGKNGFGFAEAKL
ncbi:MAG: hypothetical protein MUC93_11560 [Bacteroidales bacterium]|jgi:predicted GH43/DUF377 family glycosyl hydrolase|nr:hypothetical protein [Bacteroidales bacterium]